MTVLLYGVTRADAPLPLDVGLSGRPLRALRHRDLRAVLSDHDAAPAPEPDTLWDYEAVVERLMGEAPIAPARFGTTAESDEALREFLGARHDELRDTLQRIAGAVELAVRLPGPLPATHSGTDYLLGRAEQQRRLTAFEAAVSPGLTRAVRQAGPTALALLVDAEHAQTVARLSSEHGLGVTGPWPPYSFVEHARGSDA